MKEASKSQLGFFPADAKSAVFLEPSDGAFASPAVAQGLTILTRGAVGSFRSDHPDTSGSEPPDHQALRAKSRQKILSIGTSDRNQEIRPRSPDHFAPLTVLRLHAGLQPIQLQVILQNAMQ